MTHIHDILDSDKRFTIDPITRNITNQTENKVLLMQYDHNSERFTFEVDRYIEGHDMSLSTVAQVHYNNGTDQGVYQADDLQVSPDDEEKVIFSWLISRNATQKSTTLNFLVKFRCYEDGNIVYEWNSAIFSKITVGSGIDGGESIIEEYPDILADLNSRVTALEAMSFV